MCGIAGVLSVVSAWRHDLRSVAGAMAASLRHRGPDDGGLWADGDAGIALAHRRLAIIDTTGAGHQPMESRCSRYVISYNGEIYNFPALRHELERSGTGFRTQSDTEVLLEAISEWGLRRALARLVGMFAFAVWDRQERSLVLVRDRGGEKPLYYGLVGNAFVFASELKAFQFVPEFDRRIDATALALYTRRSYVPAPFSIFAAIRKLPPGHQLVVTRGIDGGVSLRRESYWRASDSLSGREISYPEAREEAERLLRQSVYGQLRSDVPLGAFLSGGLDSTAVVALMQEQSSTPVKTFSIGYAEAEYDESRMAAEVARRLGTQHTELRVTPEDALAVVPELARIYDEPFADSSQLPTVLVARLARRHVTVALSGDAGDEVFGGYNRYVFAPRVWARASRWPRSLRRTAAEVIRVVPAATWDRLGPLLSGFAQGGGVRLLGEKMHKIARILPAESPAAMYEGLVSCWMRAPIAGGGSLGGADWFGTPAPLTEAANFARLMMYLDFVTYLPDDILVKVDRATMSASLESRVPLLDHRLFEFMNSLPIDYKITAQGTKRILRDVVYDRLPRDIVDRPKTGFGVPIDEWLRGPLREWAETLLDPHRLEAQGIFAVAEVRRAWRDHQSGRPRHHELWAILMFLAWADEYRGTP